MYYPNSKPYFFLLLSVCKYVRPLSHTNVPLPLSVCKYVRPLSHTNPLTPSLSMQVREAPLSH